MQYVECFAPIKRGSRMSAAQGMAMRLCLGLCVLFGLLGGCATGGQATLPPNTPQATAPSTPPATCNGSEPKSCYDLGFLYSQGQGVPKDERRAAALHEQACTGGHTGSTQGRKPMTRQRRSGKQISSRRVLK